MRRAAKAPVGPKMGPAILVSGYLAKRTRSFGRWKKRWWQLTDDGTLVYFKNEERTKALGEIDVARSCYEVKFGAGQCKVEFPSAISDCCCFSFSVLKRTYYLYAATPADANRWAESIASLSVVLNYKKKYARRPAPEPPHASQRPLSTPCAPASRDGVPSKEEGNVRENRSYSMPGTRLPKVHASLSGDVIYTAIGLAAEATDKPTELPRIAKHGRGKAHRAGAVSPGNRYGSAPNLFFGTNPARGKRSSPLHNRQEVNSRLWLDGSPPPNSRAAPAGGKRQRRRPAAPQGRYDVTRHPHSDGGGSLDRLQLKKRAPPHAGQQQLITRWPVDVEGYEIPPRPQSVDVSLFPQKRGAVSKQRQKPTTSFLMIPRLPAAQTISSSLGDISKTQPSTAAPPPVKPKPILKKSRAVQSPERDLPTIREPENGASPPEIPPKHFTLKVSVNSESGQRSVFLPPPPNFKPPPPPELSSDTSTPSVCSTADGKAGTTSTTGNPGASKPANPRKNGSSSKGHWYNDPNTFLTQVKLPMLPNIHTNTYSFASYIISIFCFG